ncbi:TPA: hypothetical protein N0F65_002115 [Lagenidium giganteum]|uniref:Uncharacterized protein n=1 Tax=Lagenidium giganteum TaxID=4803 RepID=A0AAV2ZHT7_9STRA|nr:TPA: hypothetical protein N0F65_002115 [Lagenidium giganteum]
MSHLRSKHADFLPKYEASIATNCMLSNYGFVSQEVQSRYQWVDWLVSRNHPIAGRQSAHTQDVAFATCVLNHHQALHVTGLLSAPLPQRARCAQSEEACLSKVDLAHSS